MGTNYCEAEVIATGNEIIYGQIVDTNSSWIADFLTQSGIIVKKITTVADHIGDIASVINDALSQNRRLIIMTGGLGPSEDDLTIDAIAKALGSEVIIGDEALSLLKSKCDEFGIELNERRRRMARSVPSGEAIPNIVGLAPGLMAQSNSTTIFALPGIPEEMKAMFQANVLPRIHGWTAAWTRTINVRVFANNDRFMIFDKIQREFPEVYFKVHGKPPSQDRYDIQETDVGILARGADIETCEAILRKVTERLRSLLVEKEGNLEIKS
ncbi:MAG TPA: molybdopterin-binding protein [Candidatus Bathyarchaeia archaeon]|nr:molybdopterin-binding protein [Candidatus Bathyarchaeia archaeon]